MLESVFVHVCVLSHVCTTHVCNVFRTVDIGYELFFVSASLVVIVHVGQVFTDTRLH